MGPEEPVSMAAWTYAPLSAHGPALLVATLVLVTAGAAVQLPKEKERAFFSATSGWVTRYDATVALLAVASQLFHVKKIAAHICFGLDANECPAGAAGTMTWRECLASSRIVSATVTSAAVSTLLVALQLSLMTRHVTAYQRWRCHLMAFGRAVRLLYFLCSTLPEVMPLEKTQAPRTVWEEWFDVDMTQRIHMPAVLVLARILFLHSGASHLTIFNILTPLPSAWGALFQLPNLAMVVLGVAPRLTAMTRAHPNYPAPTPPTAYPTYPAARNATDMLCDAVRMSLDVLVSWQPAAIAGLKEGDGNAAGGGGSSCSHAAVEVMLVWACIILGCILPTLVVTYMEYTSKSAFLTSQGIRNPRSVIGTPLAWQAVNISAHVLLMLLLVVLMVVEDVLLPAPGIRARSRPPAPVR